LLAALFDFGFGFGFGAGLVGLATAAVVDLAGAAFFSLAVVFGAAAFFSCRSAEVAFGLAVVVFASLTVVLAAVDFLAVCFFSLGAAVGVIAWRLAQPSFPWPWSLERPSISSRQAEQPAPQSPRYSRR
jgi:hypothetical protein